MEHIAAKVSVKIRDVKFTPRNNIKTHPIDSDTQINPINLSCLNSVSPHTVRPYSVDLAQQNVPSNNQGFFTAFSTRTMSVYIRLACGSLSAVSGPISGVLWAYKQALKGEINKLKDKLGLLPLIMIFIWQYCKMWLYCSHTIFCSNPSKVLYSFSGDMFHFDILTPRSRKIHF